MRPCTVVIYMELLPQRRTSESLSRTNEQQRQVKFKIENWEIVSFINFYYQNIQSKLKKNLVHDTSTE